MSVEAGKHLVQGAQEMITVRLSLPVARILRFETAETFVFNGYEIELYAHQGETFLGKVGVDASDLNLSIDVAVPLDSWTPPVAADYSRVGSVVIVDDNPRSDEEMIQDDSRRGYFEQLEDGRTLTPSPTPRA